MRYNNTTNRKVERGVQSVYAVVELPIGNVPNLSGLLISNGYNHVSFVPQLEEHPTMRAYISEHRHGQMPTLGSIFNRSKRKPILSPQKCEPDGSSIFNEPGDHSVSDAMDTAMDDYGDDDISAPPDNSKRVNSAVSRVKKEPDMNHTGRRTPFFDHDSYGAADHEIVVDGGDIEEFIEDGSYDVFPQLAREFTSTSGILTKTTTPQQRNRSNFRYPIGGSSNRNDLSLHSIAMAERRQLQSARPHRNRVKTERAAEIEKERLTRARRVFEPRPGYMKCEVCHKYVQMHPHDSPSESQAYANLVRHMKTHGEKEWECPVPWCAHQNSRSFDCRKHMRTRHQINGDPVHKLSDEMQLSWIDWFKKCYPSLKGNMQNLTFKEKPPCDLNVSDQPDHIDQPEHIDQPDQPE